MEGMEFSKMGSRRKELTAPCKGCGKGSRDATITAGNMGNSAKWLKRKISI